MRWRITADLRIGRSEGEGPDLFGEVVGVAEGPDGLIAVADGQANEVRVFDGAGRHRWSVGRRGAGPGEFGAISGLRWDGWGRLWVADVGNARYAVFDSAGGHVKDVPGGVAGAVLPWMGGVGRDGGLYDVAPLAGADGWMSFTYFRSDTGSGAVQDSFPPLRFPLPGLLAPSLAALNAVPRPVFAFDAGGSLWFGNSGEYRIAHRSLAGDIVLVVTRRHTPVEFSSAEVDSILAARNDRLRGVPPLTRRQIPDRKPVFERLYVDAAGRLLVQLRGAGSEDGRRFDVFDPEGRHLGQAIADVRFVTLPAPPVFRDGSVVGVAMDSGGTPQVVRGRFVPALPRQPCRSSRVPAACAPRENGLTQPATDFGART